MPDVAKRIEELREEFKASAALSVEYLQRQLLPAAEANMLDFFQFEDGKPRLRNLTELKREHGAAIAAVKVADDGTIEVKLHSKNEAVNVLLRSVGGFVDRHELSGRDGKSLTLESLVTAYQVITGVPRAPDQVASGEVNETPKV
jgi:hypothetical protein